MARPDISQVNITDTFQIWLNKTNEVVAILNNNALTASLGSGDTTIGNAILEGSFTANTVITSETRTQTLQHEIVPTDAILSLSPISVESAVETVLSVKSTSSKPIVSLINQANLRWNIEHETSLSSSSILFKTAGAGTPQATLTQAGRLQATAFQGDGNLLTNLNPNNIGSGEIPSENIADLDANKITTGTLGVARIPNLDASKITTGVLGVARIPNLDSGKITTGVLGVARIPDLDAGKITTGVLPVSRGGTGATTAPLAREALGLATVAATGAYGDLSGRPTIPGQLNQTQVEDPTSTVFGTVSGQRLEQQTNAAFNVSGAAPKYACRAWVNFNGTGTVAIRASGNVSSITDNGRGDYTVNFATAMPDANYILTTQSPVATDATKGTVGLSGGYNSAADLKTTTQCRIRAGGTTSLSFTDFLEVHVAFFR